MANPDLVRKLMEGAAAWNQWRSENPDASIDLGGADLRDIELPGANLREANLDSCNLRDAILDGADLSSTRLTNVNLTGAQLHAASLSKTVGRSTNFNNADASGANFGEAKFFHSNFGGARLVGANLRNAILKDSTLDGTKLNRSDLTRTDFRDSNLTDAVFEDASLEGAELRRCKLNRASFKSANLSNADLRRGQLNGTNLVDAKLTRTNLRNVTGLTCDQLTQAQDWRTAYRDDELACGAEIPDPGETSATASESVEPTEMSASIVELFGADISRWQDDIAEDERRARLERSQRALLELERALTDLRNRSEHGQMGHNMPPEPMIPDEVLDQYVAEVRAGTALHDAPYPDKTRLSRLIDSLDRFRLWLQPRIDIAADSAAKVIGATAGAAAGATAGATAVVLATTLLEKLLGALEALGNLIKMLI